jgi:tetratricopeptide (TPR) repeat protein
MYPAQADPPAPPLWPQEVCRRLRSLLKTGPFHRLRQGEGRHACLRPHDDTTALCMQALDALVAALGISQGVSREDLHAALSPLQTAADLQADVPPDPARHHEVAELILGLLLNDGARRQAYREEYLDFSCSPPTPRALHFRLATEQETPDGRIVIHVEPDGVNLFLRSLDIELEDAQAATEAALRAQLQRGRFDLALQSAREAHIRSVQYDEKIRALLRKTQRDVGNVDWRREVPRLLKEALAHLETRLRTEGEIQKEIHACLLGLGEDDASPAGGPGEDLSALEALQKVRDMIERCCQRHLRLHRPLLSAHQVFLDEQARQRFAPLPLRRLCAPERELLKPLLLQQRQDAAACTDAFAAAATPPRPPLLLDLGRLWDTLLQKRRQAPQRGAQVVSAEDLTPLRQEPPLFDDEVRAAVDAQLLSLPAPARLSELLPACPDLPSARLLTLRCLHHFAPDTRALPLQVDKAGEDLPGGDFCGDDLIIQLAAEDVARHEAPIPGPGPGRDSAHAS